MALPSQPEHPGRRFTGFGRPVARGFQVTFEIEPIKSPLLVDILRMDLAGRRRGVEKLNIDEVQFAFHYPQIARERSPPLLVQVLVCVSRLRSILGKSRFEA